MAIEATVLPLKTAYAFGSEHDLQAEVDEIRGMEIGWNLSYTSSVRRGYVVELFEKRGLLEEFKAKHWAYGNTPGGVKERDRYLRIKKRYDDFLEGQAPPPDEAEEEADQQFAAEADLRDFLAKTPTCIEAGLRLALSLAAFEARIVEASWFADCAPSLPLGEGFHPRRLRLISSQVGSIAPAMRGRRTHRERLALALDLLADSAFDALLEPPTAFADLPEAMPRLLRGGLCHVVTYRSEACSA